LLPLCRFLHEEAEICLISIGKGESVYAKI
jgi:hypothetical protein